MISSGEFHPNQTDLDRVGGYEDPSPDCSNLRKSDCKFRKVEAGASLRHHKTAPTVLLRCSNFLGFLTYDHLAIHFDSKVSLFELSTYKLFFAFPLVKELPPTCFGTSQQVPIVFAGFVDDPIHVDIDIVIAEFLCHVNPREEGTDY